MKTKIENQISGTKKRNKLKINDILALLIFVIGLSIFLYPIVSSYLAEKAQASVIEKYEEELNSQSKEYYEEELQKAIEYNESLLGDPVHDPFVPGSGYALPDNYLSVLNIKGVMGYISIPKISVKLPIYHGSNEITLSKGVGHIESTTLPIGGEGRHSVLTGHRGLPNAKMFTDLNLLKEGDYFYIYVLDQVLVYKVDQIKTIIPEELSELAQIPGHDYITLITCTPYGVNTHRLLVRGERTEYIPEEEAVSSQKVTDIIKKNIYQIVGIVIGIVILIVIYIVYGLVKKYEKI